MKSNFVQLIRFRTLSLSLCLCVCLSVCLSVCVSVSLSLSLSHRSLFPIHSVFHSVFFSQSISLSVSPSRVISVRLGLGLGLGLDQDQGQLVLIFELYPDISGSILIHFLYGSIPTNLYNSILIYGSILIHISVIATNNNSYNIFFISYIYIFDSYYIYLLTDVLSQMAPRTYGVKSTSDYVSRLVFLFWTI